MKHSLLVATTNQGKLREFRALLPTELPVELLSLHDVFVHPPEVLEDGDGFLANATKKAIALARSSHMLTLADDSGLEVDALGGRPGVRSARFAKSTSHTSTPGSQGQLSTSDDENNAALLAALAEQAPAPPTGTGTQRFFTARFRCALVLVDPYPNDTSRDVSVVHREATCEGGIVLSPRGTGGFGYDPLFFLHELGKTMAELTPEEKNRVSHRSRAIRALAPEITDVLERRSRVISRVLREASVRL